MGIAGDFLRRVLNEYEEILIHNPELRTKRCPDDAIIRRIRRSLEEVHNIVAAMKWLEENSKAKCSPEERSYYLYLLLSRLDDVFSEKPVVRVEPTCSQPESEMSWDIS